MITRAILEQAPHALEFQLRKIDVSHWIPVTIFLVTRVIGNENATGTELYQARIRTIAACREFAQSIEFTVHECADHHFGNTINDITTSNKRMVAEASDKGATYISVEIAASGDLEIGGESN